MKCYARVACVSRAVPTMLPLFELDFVMLTGDKRSDRIIVDPGHYSNEGVLVVKLKQKLIAKLNALYAPETFVMSDIVLFGG